MQTRVMEEEHDESDALELVSREDGTLVVVHSETKALTWKGCLQVILTATAKGPSKKCSVEPR